MQLFLARETVRSTFGSRGGDVEPVDRRAAFGLNNTTDSMT